MVVICLGCDLGVNSVREIGCFSSVEAQNLNEASKNEIWQEIKFWKGRCDQTVCLGTEFLYMRVLHGLNFNVK